MIASKADDEAGTDPLDDGGTDDTEEVRSPIDMEESRSVAETEPVVEDWICEAE